VTQSDRTTLKTCQYPQHRPSDWRLRQGQKIMCGVCHPPAPKLVAVDAVVFRNQSREKEWLVCPYCGSSGAVNIRGHGVSRRSLEAMPCEHCGSWGCVPVTAEAVALLVAQAERERRSHETRTRHQ
jgi:hypothetical protein